MPQTRVTLATSARAGLVVAGAWDGLMAWTYLRVWREPGVLAYAHDVKWLVGVMLVEFLLLHAAPLMGAVMLSDLGRSKKLRTLLSLGALYGLFAAGFAASLKSWWPMATVAFMVIEKLAAAWLGRHDDDAAKAELHWSWGMSLLCYLLAMGMTVPFDVPRWGLDHRVIAAQGFTGDGLWERAPQHALCAGALYFGMMCLLRLNVARRGSVARPNTTA